MNKQFSSTYNTNTITIGEPLSLTEILSIYRGFLTLPVILDVQPSPLTIYNERMRQKRIARTIQTAR